jgi:hypothetical protein
MNERPTLLIGGWSFFFLVLDFTWLSGYDRWRTKEKRKETQMKNVMISVVVAVSVALFGVGVFSSKVGVNSAVDNAVSSVPAVQVVQAVDESNQSVEPMGGCYCCIFCQYPQTGCCQMCCPR